MVHPWVKQVKAASKGLKKVAVAPSKKREMSAELKEILARKKARQARQAEQAQVPDPTPAPETVATVTVPTA